MELTPVLEDLEENQRADVDSKVESLHKHWKQLKNIAKTRTDLATLYIQFLDESESLEKVFNEVELILKTAANEENLKQIEKAWGVIKPAFGEIKQTGGRVIGDLAKVSGNQGLLREERNHPVHTHTRTQCIFVLAHL